LYRQQVEQKIGLGVNYIDKQDFLPFYQQARAEVLYKKNIQSSFAATGLILYKPERVLLLLHAPVYTPSLQLQLQPDTYTTAILYNITQLQQQTELIQQYLKHRTQSPHSPIDQALGQLLKGCQIAIYNTVLLASQNKKLIAENYRQKQKRAKRRLYIAKEGILTRAEAQVLINNKQSSYIEAVQGEQAEMQQRALPRCSLYRSLEYKAPTCPGYQYTN
jgi:hypothetical protein